MKTEKIDKWINNFKRKKIHKLKFYIFLDRTGTFHMEKQQLMIWIDLWKYKYFEIASIYFLKDIFYKAYIVWCKEEGKILLQWKLNIKAQR